MKKTFIAVALLSSFAASASDYHYEEKKDSYLLGGYSSWDLEGNSDSTGGIVATFGADLSEHVGIEISGTYHADSESVGHSYIDIDLVTISVAPVIFYDVNDFLRIYGKAGLAYGSFSIEVCNVQYYTNGYYDYYDHNCAYADESETAFTFGAGLQASFTDSFIGRLSYDKYNADLADMGMINVQLGFKF